MGARIERPFFESRAPEVAKQLLGKLLVRVVEGKRLSGVIVETEAYKGSGDPASHAYRGRTNRNEVMFGEPGHAYVYFTMGIHHCLNVTCEPSGVPAAVLIRAIEPVEGVDEMRKNRGREDVSSLADGPGKLTKALRIQGDLNGEDMVTSGRLFLEEGERVGPVAATSRVGISVGAEYKWRFFVKGNPFVSKGRPARSKPRTHNYRCGRSVKREGSSARP